MGLARHRTGPHAKNGADPKADPAETRILCCGKRLLAALVLTPFPALCH